jgi:hypothetical protein
MLAAVSVEESDTPPPAFDRRDNRDIARVTASFGVCQFKPGSAADDLFERAGLRPEALIYAGAASV